MRQRPEIHMTQEDRETVRRWQRIMLPAVFVVILTLLGADRAYQTLWPPALANQVADEASRVSADVKVSRAQSTR